VHAHRHRFSLLARHRRSRSSKLFAFDECKKCGEVLPIENQQKEAVNRKHGSTPIWHVSSLMTALSLYPHAYIMTRASLRKCSRVRAASKSLRWMSDAEGQKDERAVHACTCINIWPPQNVSLVSCFLHKSQKDPLQMFDTTKKRPEPTHFITPKK